jgi:formate--tetrahydrofolate ligase
MKTDIEIAREADIRPIEAIASKIGVDEKYLEKYGKFKAKVNLSLIKETQGYQKRQINFSDSNISYSGR